MQKLLLLVKKRLGLWVFNVHFLHQQKQYP